MRSRSIVALALVLMLAPIISACGEHARAPKNSEPVLILMECQSDYLSPDGKLPVLETQAGTTIASINAMVKASHNAAVPVIYVSNDYSSFDFIDNPFRNGAAVRYTPGQVLDPRIDDTAGVAFEKHVPSAFANSEFDSHLQIVDRGHLVIAGVAAGDGIVETARDAIVLGYQVTVISDAVAAFSDSDREAVLRDLRAAGAQLQTSSEFIAAIGAGAKA